MYLTDGVQLTSSADSFVTGGFVRRKKGENVEYILQIYYSPKHRWTVACVSLTNGVNPHYIIKSYIIKWRRIDKDIKGNHV